MIFYQIFHVLCTIHYRQWDSAQYVFKDPDVAETLSFILDKYAVAPADNAHNNLQKALHWLLKDCLLHDRWYKQSRIYVNDLERGFVEHLADPAI